MEKISNIAELKCTEEWQHFILESAKNESACPAYRGNNTLGLLRALTRFLRVSHFLVADQLLSVLMGVREQDMRLFVALSRAYSSAIFKLAESSAHVLNANRLFSLINTTPSRIVEEMSRKSSIAALESDSGDSADGMDAIPLAYDEQRDSRGGKRQNNGERGSSLLHSNQQRIRDLLHSWIRGHPHIDNSVCNTSNHNYGYNHSYNPKSTRNSNRSLDCHEIVALVQEKNFPWFAELLIREYEQLERHSKSSKLERLEERLTKAVSYSSDNAVLKFIQRCDSFKLNLTMQQMLFGLVGRILQPIIDGNRRAEPYFSSSILRIYNLGRLFGHLTFEVAGLYEDPILCFMRDSMAEAHQGAYLLAVLPMIVAWIRTCRNTALDEIISSLRDSYHRLKDANSMAISILLESIPTKSANPSAVGSTPMDAGAAPDNAFTTPLDRDQSICGLEAILSRCVPDFKVWIMELRNINVPVKEVPFDGSATTASVQNAVATPPRRKIRPIIAEACTDGELIQKKLRQWFWWQYPSFREYSYALVEYIKGEGHKGSGAIDILWKVIPPLLPEALQARSGRMAEIVICLLLERLEEEKGENVAVMDGDDSPDKLNLDFN